MNYLYIGFMVLFYAVLSVYDLTGHTSLSRIQETDPERPASRTDPIETQNSTGSHLQLELPVACEMGVTCVIHKYVDHDASPNRKDYRCGRLSRDGDTGTDFRTLTLKQMTSGVDVIAAADGVVRAVRDGMADISVRATNAPSVNGREAGNAVVLTHPGGWETQYSHLLNKSVKVKPGQSVKRGDILGQIGLSGSTEFPHVEFSVRQGKQPIDPFVGLASEDWACGMATRPLWSPKALSALPYDPTDVLSAGLATSRVDISSAREGQYDDIILTTDSAAIIMWVDIFGAERGDKQHFELVGPNGETIFENTKRLEKHNIAWFTWAGHRKPDQGWQPGTYHFRYVLTREGKREAATTHTFTIPQTPTKP